MRLIDADSITEKIMSVFEEALRIALKSGTFDLEGVMLKIKCYLDNQPTAFDVDKIYKKAIDDFADKIATYGTYDDYGNVIDVLEIAEKLKAGGRDE